MCVDRSELQLNGCRIVGLAEALDLAESTVRIGDRKITYTMPQTTVYPTAKL